MSTIWAFDNIENKHPSYCGEDCMKNFCESLREHAKNIIDFEKKNMLPLTKEELKSHQYVKVCYICGKRFLKKFAMTKIIEKLETMVILQVNIEVQHIIYLIKNLMCLMKYL